MQSRNRNNGRKRTCLEHLNQTPNKNKKVAWVRNNGIRVVDFGLTKSLNPLHDQSRFQSTAHVFSQGQVHSNSITQSRSQVSRRMTGRGQS